MANSPLKVVTLNVNGIRAAFRKGMVEWLRESKPDILCLQEVRAANEDIEGLFATVTDASPTGEWHILHDMATAKGRAGVAVVSSVPSVAHSTVLGPDDFDSAGRWLEAEFELSGENAGVHSGEVDTPKQVEKYKFLEAMTARMAELLATRAYVVVLGDLNVGHTELDIKNWKGNLKNAGFLPQERAYFDGFMNEQGWRDLGRDFHPEEPGPYTWWSQRGQAFDTNTGWRIDYQLATPKLASVAKSYAVHRAASYDTRWTDHSPVVVEYAL
jgi:exodeoxyribonuclease-3